MKKLSLVVSSVLLMGSVYAQSINIKSGWELKGISGNIHKMSTFDNSCVDYIWKYDRSGDIAQWKVYSTHGETIFETIDSITYEDGFWVKSSSDCVITLENESNQTMEQEKQEQVKNDIQDIEKSELTQEQKDGLVFMYQEEKVARDVYNYLYQLWGAKVFINIAKAEQSHMDAVKSILEKYELDIASDEAGVFELEELQKLYDDLVAMGSVSYDEAIKVGVLVEETDIKDLEELIIDAPEDIKVIYQNLLDGSYKHLDAFNKQVN